MTSDPTFGRLPGEWKVFSLGDLLTRAQYGLSVRGNRQGAYPILRMTNQVGGRIIARDLQFADIGHAELEKFRVEPGDLLFNRTNSFELVGRTAIFELEGDFVFASYLIRLRTASKLLDPQFLCFYLNGDETQQRLKSIATRAVSQSNISATRLKTFSIPVPPLNEQRQIAAVLSAVRRAIERQERLIALTAELKKTLMHKLFTEGTRGEPLKVTEIGQVPESWNVMPLGSLFSHEPTNGLYRPQSDYGEGTSILRIDDFSNDGDIVTTASYRVAVGDIERLRFGLAKDDIVLNRVNSLSHLGKTALVGQIAEPMLFESNMMRFRVDEKQIRAAFAFRVLNSPICKRQIIGTAKRAVAQSSINQGDVSRLLIPRPDLKTQDEILKILDALVNKSKVHHRTRQSLEQLFRTLLQHLMTAQIRVQDLDLTALKSNLVGAA